MPEVPSLRRAASFLTVIYLCAKLGNLALKTAARLNRPDRLVRFSPLTPLALSCLYWITFQGGASNGKISFTQLCPKPSSVPLPSTAPTAAEYRALVQTLATRYGAKLDVQTRIALDSGVTQAGANAGSLPALLVPAGAINEAVYAGAVAAERNPLDVNAANNLGVSLDQAADYPSAARVLLYLTSLRPQSPLAHRQSGPGLFQCRLLPLPNGSWRALRSSGVKPLRKNAQSVIAGCQGDMASANNLLGSSLKKGYSTAGAVGFMAAQQAQPSSSATDAGWDRRLLNHPRIPVP